MAGGTLPHQIPARSIDAGLMLCYIPTNDLPSSEGSRDHVQKVRSVRFSAPIVGWGCAPSLLSVAENRCPCVESVGLAPPYFGLAKRFMSFGTETASS